MFAAVKHGQKVVSCGETQYVTGLNPAQFSGNMHMLDNRALSRCDHLHRTEQRRATLTSEKRSLPFWTA
jgi:hypothetical protein